MTRKFLKKKKLDLCSNSKFGWNEQGLALTS